VIDVSECLNTVAAGTLLGSGDGGRKIPHPPAITLPINCDEFLCSPQCGLSE
jgi:hypothetical protein